MNVVFMIESAVKNCIVFGMIKTHFYTGVFMQQLPFKTVVSDLDGTLLNANHVNFTIDVLNKLEQKVLILF